MTMLRTLMERLTSVFVITPLKMMGYVLGVLFVIYSFKELMDGHFTAFVFLVLTVGGIAIYRRRNSHTPEPVYEDELDW